MAEWYMFTEPWSIEAAGKWLNYFKMFDIHKWILAEEYGNGGYHHIQGRVRTPHTFEQLKATFPKAHFEECQPSMDYEAKGGRYWTSEDYGMRRACRFAQLNIEQQAVYRTLMAQDDRKVTVWYNSSGNRGKSFLGAYLWERGLAYHVQMDNPRTMIRDVASEFIKHGWRPIVMIDIPRTAQWSDDLYYSIEKIKDGLIKDERYDSKTVNIRGIKLLITTNSMPNLNALSHDRWEIITDGVAHAPDFKRFAAQQATQQKTKKKKKGESPTP